MSNLSKKHAKACFSAPSGRVAEQRAKGTFPHRAVGERASAGVLRACAGDALLRRDYPCA